MQDIHLSELMTTKVSTVELHTSLREALEGMTEQRISCQIVLDQQRPVGILTERDMAPLLLQLRDDPDILERSVRQFMSAPLVCADRQSSLYESIRLCEDRRIRHLPVVDDGGRLCGLVTQSDIAEAHFRVVERRAEEIESIVHEQTVSLRQQNSELRALSLEDPLMAIGNRSAMEQDLEHTHAAALRYQHQYCIALIDVDYFKQYNDHYGHSAGDEVLRKVADVLRQNMRSTDRIYRYGGEEILIVLADSDAAGAYVFMHRAIMALAAEGIPHCESPFGVLTGSAGVAEAIDAGQCSRSWTEVVRKADRALYSAKNVSRNTVSIAA